ncbi:hypothetical protein ACFL1B_03775 [Nanoarchaeota archaeon]
MGYELPREAQGAELIEVLSGAAESLGYNAEVVPLNETCSNIATLAWRISGTGLSHNNSYEGRKIKDVDPRVKSVRVSAENPDKGGWLRNLLRFPVQDKLWTAEAIVDEEGTYDALYVTLHTGDGIVCSRGLNYLHFARQLPLDKGKDFDRIKPEVDSLASEVRRALQEMN